MADGLAELITSGLTTLAKVKAIGEALKVLDKIAPKEDGWYTDCLLHLSSEAAMEYIMLIRLLQEPDEHTKLSKPAEMAWRARNLLELNVWTRYFLEDIGNARSFYEDKTRDFVDWIKAAEKIFVSIIPQVPGVEVEQHLKELVAVRERTVERASNAGVEKATYSFTRVSEAAKSIGQAETFSSLNKFLSKLAHPTAFTIFTLSDDSYRALVAQLCAGIGSACFRETLEAIEKYTAEANP